MRKTRFGIIMLASLLAGLSVESGNVNHSQEGVAQAATIKYKGKRYHSKYTIKQMRRKYHLVYKTKAFKVSKSLTNHLVWNRYEGIVKNPSIRRENKMPMFVTAHGKYAAFLTAYVEAAFNSKMAYVNLKTGQLVMSHSGWE